MSDNKKKQKKLTFLSDLIPIKAFVCKYIDNVKGFLESMAKPFSLIRIPAMSNF